jgi:hypothetical protein
MPADVLNPILVLVSEQDGAGIALLRPLPIAGPPEHERSLIAAFGIVREY